MAEENEIFETDPSADAPDPDATPIRDRKVVTQPYDLAIDAIVGQVRADILFLRPLSSRPNFQRQYVWNDKLASKLVESVLLNVPIPPCYLSENEDNELDVIEASATKTPREVKEMVTSATNFCRVTDKLFGDWCKANICKIR